MKRPCSVCHELTERHVFKNTSNEVIEAFCDDHCPRCWQPKKENDAA